MPITKNGKYPEDVRRINRSQILQDDKFLLMKQCIADARQLHKMLRHFEGNSVTFSDWDTYEKTVTQIACTLFTERCKSPLKVKDLRKLILGFEDANQTLQDINERNKELLETLKKIDEAQNRLAKLKAEYRKMQEEIAEYQASRLLKDTIGEDDLLFYKHKGYIYAEGKNESIYKITAKGEITKFIKTDQGYVPEWTGKVVKTGGLPMPDVVATIYMHIKRDSDKFDADKMCGEITIE